MIGPLIWHESGKVTLIRERENEKGDIFHLKYSNLNWAWREMKKEKHEYLNWFGSVRVESLGDSMEMLGRCNENTFLR
jgi:hypothetical protein